ncbi:hypothetical protein, partial [Streptomyces sp. NPDC031705]|uniref:hypothetical protein n=1 Tax=Streptomyces sp. NPDC031705 TaxID=3155729 RepID=UPI0033C983E8
MVTARSSRTPRARASAGLLHLLGLTLLLLGLLCAHGAGAHAGAAASAAPAALPGNASGGWRSSWRPPARRCSSCRTTGSCCP